MYGQAPYSTITLTQGFVTTVDNADADLGNYNWQVLPKAGGRYYAKRQEKRRKDGSRPLITMHRVILERKLGRSLSSAEFVDHVDGNGLNNCRRNLRLATNAQNQQNARRPIDNTSGYKGVRFNNGKWMARISVNGKRLYLGVYDTPELAYKSYCDAATQYHKEFARLK